jgi:hypothetical protein
MKKINPDGWYTGIEAQEFIKVKSRPSITKYIREGYLLALQGGEGVGKRYLIKGEWILSFLERYVKGLVKGEKYTKAELKKLLEGAVEYCQKNNISTLVELSEHINKLN